MTPRTAARLLALVLGCLALAAPTARAEDPPAMEGGPAPAPADSDEADGPVPFVEAVNAAIPKGVEFLKKRQGADGSWGPVVPAIKYDPTRPLPMYTYPAGTAALGAFTLLKCGVPADDPAVKKAFAFLRKHKQPASSYEASMLLLAVTATADPFKRIKASAAAGERVKLSGDFRKWAQDLADLLVRKREPVAWRYNRSGIAAEKGGNQDLSSTQLAILALLAAERCGIAVDGKVWNDVIPFVMAQQEPTGPEHPRAVHARALGAPPAAEAPMGEPGGTVAPSGGPGTPEGAKDRARGFSYIRDPSIEPDDFNPTGGMTACGVGILMAARYVLTQRGDKAWKKRDPAPVQQSIYDGLAWLDANWHASQNPGKKEWNVYDLYYLYAVERAMDLAGASRLGKHTWYVEMGQHLVDTQKPDGSWETKTTIEPFAVLDTCFALLFLKRATRGGIPYPTVTGGADEPPADGR